MPGGFPPDGFPPAAPPDYPGPEGQPVQRGWLLGLVFGGAALLVVAIVLIVAALLSPPAEPHTGLLPAHSDRAEAPAPTPTSLPTRAPDPSSWPRITAGPPPSLDDAEVRVLTLDEKYRMRGEARAKVPQTEAGERYARDFLYLLNDLKFAVQITGSGTPEGEKIADDAEELERKFLAGEDFGVSIKITRGDGSVYESDGANHSRED
ncbi:hypothetical protein [Mycetocola spongiae]|uniref:hypothetical protein n=1 Tax=Mycetocola spongiae TaxID=2859226 RepID=UPI001CF34897|nr:hypothetical protein [Mycetocola spongiae]UCR88718.1 hypothetical protein KXZ72_12260 [Mycetocola spongiae]